MQGGDFKKPQGEHGPYVATGGRKGDWFQTSLGIQFWPLDPRPEEIDLRDIAKALSNMCRFGGHVPKGFYCVAQHSMLVSYHVELEASAEKMDHEVVRMLAATALMHDATEAYLVDVPRPIKHHLGAYRDIEDRLAFVIGEKYGLPLADLPELVKKHDRKALMTEKRDLIGPAPAPWTGVNGYPDEPWEGGFMAGSQHRSSAWPLHTPREAERLFLARAEMLGLRWGSR